MIVNLIIVFITIITGLIFWDKEGKSTNKSDYRKYYIIFISIILTLQSGLRHIGIGTDTSTYSYMYEEVMKSTWSDIIDQVLNYYKFGISKDPGYLVFEKIVQSFLPNYQTYLILVAIIFFTALGNFIYQNTTRIIDAIFAFILYTALFYEFFSITGIRQTLATAATLWGIELIKKRKLILFLILILIASTIHKSVLIFIPFYFIGNIRNTKLIYSSAIILFPACMMFRRSFSIILALISASDAYMEFAVSTYEAGTYTFTTLLLLIAIFGWVFLKRVIKASPEAFRFYNAIALAVIFTPLTWVDPSFMRVVQYFSIFMLVFIPTIIDSIKFDIKSGRNIIYAIMIASLILLIAKKGDQYKFFWQYMEYNVVE
jgi:hypothetical protein